MGELTDWDAEAATYDEPADHGLRDPAVREAWRGLLGELLPPPPARVADLGCGTGSLSRLLAEDSYDVDGVDLSPAMLERARAKAGALVRFHQGDAADPPLGPGGHDVVLCRHVLWTLPDPVAALRRWVALLRPEGRLVLVEGLWSTGAGFTGERTLDLCAQAGLRTAHRPLTDPAYWGGPTGDERYAVVARV